LVGGGCRLRVPKGIIVKLADVKHIIEARRLVREHYDQKGQLLAEIEALLAAWSEGAPSAAVARLSDDELTSLLPHATLEARQLAEQLPAANTHLAALEQELQRALVEEVNQRTFHEQRETERRRAFQRRIAIAVVFAVVMMYWMAKA
jgi:GGDEF domain-containing protein